ncbi:hybrid sensor histidine kinase/response regulator [Salinivibrio sp. ES.052]|uniref:hybrid sensor histidine kinase/response regulator n=1 Tax=Salinivibrio sp. ES.052 TaxID=1882823 RepID=UPI00158807E7|nr:hybrid sensor histidine kinase/response regulator [Salinivibrio sp. ES.052]
MTFITLMVLGLSVSSYIMQERVNQDVERATNQEIPSAIITMKMLRAASDMNASMLKYVMGRHESLAVFLENQQTFENSLKKLRDIKPKPQPQLSKISQLYERFQRIAHQKVLTEFDPVAEQWARKQVMRLSIDVVRPIDNLIAELKAAQSLTQPDNVAILQYLDELVDENGDMLTELNQYLEGRESSRQHFVEDMATFERYLSLAQFELNDPASLKKVALLESHFTSLKRSGIAIFNNYQPSAKVGAMMAVRTLSDQEYQSLEDALSTFAQETGKVVSGSMINLQSILHSNQLNLGYLLLFILFVSGAMYLYIYRTFTQPIAVLADSMQRLVEGDMTPPDSYFQDRTDEVGKIAQGLVIFRAHIISRNQAREQLMAEKERAESASRAKAQFLATMSHEIRTPMNGVIGMIDMLRRSSLTQSQHSLLSTVRESALSLLSIINDILDFSRTEAGKLQFERVTFSLSETVEQVMDTVSHEASKRNVTLSLFIAPNLPDQYIGDPNRLKQVLFNLVGNAIKFSGGSNQVQGLVDVRIVPSITAPPKQAGLSFIISDNGIGIDPDKLETIFQPFNQAESSTTREYGGSGLGLAICKNIIDLLNGDIEINSEQGKGTQFTVNLSYGICPLAEQPSAPIDYHNIASLLIYLDLPDSALKTAICAYLDHLGIKHDTVDLEQTARTYDQDHATHHIILITKRTNPDNAINRLAVDHVIVLKETLSLATHPNKRIVELFASPLTYRRLVHGIRVCLGLESPDISMLGESNEPSLTPPPLSIEPRENAAGVIRGRILVAEDNPTNQQVLTQQLRYLGYHVVMVDDGKQALEVYQNDKFDLVLTDCHMPNKDGYALAAALREIQRSSPRVPIIAITANALSGEETRCSEAGMDDYITKPIELDQLDNRLSYWLNQRDTPAPINADDAPTKVCPPSPDVLDLSVVKRLYAGQFTAFKEIVAIFQQRSLPSLIELAQAQPPFDDWKHIKDAAHKQKSAAGSIGATELHQTCLDAEQAAQTEDTHALLEALHRMQKAMTRLVDTLDNIDANHR